MCPAAAGGARLRLHLRYRVFDQAEDGVEVDGERVAPLLVGHFVDGDVFGGPDAVVGYEDVDAAEVLYGFGDQGAGGLWAV